MMEKFRFRKKETANPLEESVIPQGTASEDKDFNRFHHQYQQQQQQQWFPQRLPQQQHANHPGRHIQQQNMEELTSFLTPYQPNQQQPTQLQQRQQYPIPETANALPSALSRQPQSSVGRPRYLEQQQQRDHGFHDQQQHHHQQQQQQYPRHYDHHHHQQQPRHTQQPQFSQQPHCTQQNQEHSKLDPREDSFQPDISIQSNCKKSDSEQDEDPYELLFDPRKQNGPQNNSLPNDHHKHLRQQPPHDPHQLPQYRSQYSESNRPENKIQSQSQQFSAPLNHPQYYEPSQQRFNHDTNHLQKEPPVSQKGPNKQTSEQFPKTILKNRDPPSYHEFQRSKLLSHQPQHSYNDESEPSPQRDFSEQSKRIPQQLQQSQKQQLENSSPQQQHQQQRHIQFAKDSSVSQQPLKKSNLTTAYQQPHLMAQQQQQHLHPTHQRVSQSPQHNHPPPSILQQHLNHQHHKQLTLQQQQKQQQQPRQDEDEEKCKELSDISHPKDISEKRDDKEMSLAEQGYQTLRPKTPCRDLQNTLGEQNPEQVQHKQQQQHAQQNLQQQQQQQHHQTEHQQMPQKDYLECRSQHDQYASLLQTTRNHGQVENSYQKSNPKHLGLHENQERQHVLQKQQQQQQQQQQCIKDQNCRQEEPNKEFDLSHCVTEEEDPRTPTPGHSGVPLSPTLNLLEYDQGRPPSGGPKLKQHTNWSGVLQDLFGLDSTHHHTAESTHESTSSGVASDVTSLYPASPQDGTGQLPLRSFKGGDSAGSASSDQQSQDSGNRSTSAPSSPKGDYPPSSSGRNLRSRGCLTAHALALDANRKASVVRAGMRTPETHPLPPTPTDRNRHDGHDSDIPPPLPQRNITPRPNLSHAPSKDKSRPHDLNINFSHQARGGRKPYLPSHADRLSHHEAGMRTECRRPMSPRGLIDCNARLPDLDPDCPCPACYSLAAASTVNHVSQGFRTGSQNRDPRVTDPAFCPDPAMSYIPTEGSFADSAVGMESFGYDGRQLGSKKLHDVERSRTNYSPASPIPLGGFYHSKHFMASFPEYNGHGHPENAHSMKSNLSHSKHKKQQKQFPSEDQRTFSQNLNTESYCQDCAHCSQHRKQYPQHNLHYHQMRPNPSTQLQHQHNHHRSKTPNNVQSSSLGDLDNSNDSLARLEYNQNGRHDHNRRQNRGKNIITTTTNNNINSSNNYSCSSSSPERVYYPHSDSTPTSTPTSHLSSDAAAVTSVNLDSNISTSSITSHDNMHNCSNSSSSRAPSRLLQTSTTPSSRPRSTTPRTPTSLDNKQHSLLVTSAEVHSSREEDKNKHGSVTAVIPSSKSAPALEQSESQVSKSSSPQVNHLSARGSPAANDRQHIAHHRDFPLTINENTQVPSSPADIPSKDKTKNSLFETLPNDLLLRIFSHLPTDHLCKCAEVCRHWYNAVWDHPALWTSIVINNPNLDINRALKYLTRRLSYNTPKVCMILEKININGCSKLTDRGLQTVVKRCPELRCLDMQGCVLVTNAGVTEAVSRCVNLERLDVTGCPLVTCISLTESVLTCAAARHLQRIYLRYLDMSDCPHVTDEDLLTVSSQCTQLLFLYLRRCPLISDLGVSYIASNCGSLREVSMSDCRNVTDLGMRELAKLGENLRYLSVAKCEKVSDHGVSHIALNCPKLRYLNVRGCEAVSDRGLELLARSCLRLRSLDVGKCDVTDAGLYALSTYCPQLRKLGLKSCDGVTDRGLVLVAYRCPQLRQLHVQDCSRLTPEAYTMVRRYCKGAFIEHTNPGVL